MEKKSLKERLIRYLKAQGGFISSGELQRIVAAKTTYTPRTTVRRLEELAETGQLLVEYRKNHAFYKWADVESPQQLAERSLLWFAAL
jgi:hypothetical protein